jgi:hypothetical protein
LSGRDLLEVKEKLPHGKWLPWVEANCSLHKVSISRYIRVFTYYPDYVCQDRVPVNLSVSAALALVHAPDDVKELVHEALADG